MVQNAEERQNILNYINLTEGKVVNVSEMLNFSKPKVLVNNWFLLQFQGTDSVSSECE